MKLRIIFFSIILLILNTGSFSYAKIETNIVVKIQNEIITNYEIKNSILSSIILAKQEINQSNINSIKKNSLNTLIQMKLKKIELSKLDIKLEQSRINNYIESISSRKVEILKNDFKNNNADFDLFLETIKIELMWQRFIYDNYSRKININEKTINDELKQLINNQKNINEIELYEIEVEINNNQQVDQQILELQNEIKKNGFKSTAMKFSNSNSSMKKGKLGWFDVKTLSKEIYNKVNTLNKGDVSQPIIKQNSILFLKVNDKRDSRLDDKNLARLKENLINKKKNELFNLYSKSHLSKLRNTTLVEYK
jgi:parvulin-like peptidyl-prolyl isomerase